MEIGVLLLFILLILYLAKPSRGRLGETQTKFKLGLALNGNVYRRVHNVIIPSRNGTTQIDHLLVSPFGVFIVETKNIKGWIFGSETQAKWTQSLYGHNYSFQNPVRQIFRQKRVLAEYLDLDESHIHTVVYFVGKCTFKTRLPSNVIKNGLGRYIKQYQEPVLSKNDMRQIIKRLNQLRSDPFLTRKNHIKSLRQRHNSDTRCPKCGSNLVERVARKGPNAGSRFLGCSSYPRCKFTKNLY